MGGPLRRAPLLIFVLVLLLFTSCLESPPGPVENAGLEETARRLVALLDYVAADYPDAVKSGEVVNALEYDEQKKFLGDAAELASSLPDDAHREAESAIANAAALVLARAPAVEVAQACRKARDPLLARYRVVLGPARTPSFEHGMVLFQQNCIACHGATGGGDGPSAAGLNPRPRDLRDPEVVRGLSPLRVFSAVTDGVRGTAMPSFSVLSVDDRWSVAFVASALGHEGSGPHATFRAVAPALAGERFDLKTLATVANADLLEMLVQEGIPPDARQGALAYLRRERPFREDRASLETARMEVEKARSAYGRGDSAATRRSLDTAYLDGFEPFEGRLASNAPALVTEIEKDFLDLREMSREKVVRETFSSRTDRLLARLLAAESTLQTGTSRWASFLAALVVMLREGLESALLVMLLLGLARRAGSPGDVKAVHAGWGVAIAAGGVTWIASGIVLKLGGRNRELLEGLVTLAAVLMLIYAGHFILARVDAQRRIAALKRRFESVGQAQRYAILFIISFAAVYREAFEMVLFLRVIALESPYSTAAIGAGALAGTGLCIGVATIVRRVGRRVNPSMFLTTSGALLCALAIVLTGKGVRSLQEAGILGVNTIALPRIDWLGVYPTLQTAAAQLVVIGLILVVTVFGVRLAARQRSAQKGGSSGA